MPAMLVEMGCRVVAIGLFMSGWTGLLAQPELRGGDVAQVGPEVYSARLDPRGDER